MGELAEGVGSELVGAGLVGRHRELDDDSQSLTLELLDRISHRRQTPHGGRGIGAGGLISGPLAAPPRAGLRPSPAGGLDCGVHLRVRQAQPSGQSPGVLTLERPVPDAGHHRRRRAQPSDSPFGGVQVQVGQGGADDELEQRHPSGQQARNARIPLLHAQVAGVQPAGVDSHEGLGGEALVLGVGPQRGLLAGRVPIEGEDDLASSGLAPLTGDHSRRGVVNVPQQAAHHPHVVRAEGGPARGHGRGHPGQVGGHDVGVALDDNDPVGAGDLPLGQVQPVEDLALVEDGGLGGVEVLGALVLL